MKVMLIFGVVLLSMLANICQADNSQSKRCQMMQAIALNVVNDRDGGMDFFTRLQKNEHLAGDLKRPLRQWLSEFTSAVYGELKNQPASEISSATYTACMGTQLNY